MDFLKIAFGSGVNLSKIKNWESVPIDRVKNSAEIAAIVIQNKDPNAQKQAQALRDQSGFSIPIIEVDRQVSTADREKIVDLAKIMNRKWCQVF